MKQRLNWLWTLCAVAALAFTSSQAQAKPLNAGSDAAFKLCRSFTFSSDQDACIAVIRDAYFDVGAVGICASLTFGSEKLDCLSKVKNKAYDPQMIGFCADKTFTSEKLACLDTNGRDVGSWPSPDMGYVRDRVEAALMRIYQNDNAAAGHILEDLLRNLGP